MKRKKFLSLSAVIVAMLIAAFLLPAATFMPLSEYEPYWPDSFWYGVGEPPVPIPPDATCEELWAPGRPGGIVQQIQNEIQRFSNRLPGEDGTLTINKPEKTWEGVTLLSGIGGITHPDAPLGPDYVYRAMLIDNDANFIHGWDNIAPIPAKLLPGGYIMGGRGGGFGGTHLVMQDWYGNEVWNWEVVGGRWHHDYNRKNSPTGYYAPGMKPKLEGKTLIVCNHDPEAEYYYPKGWVKEGHPARDTSHISNFSLSGIDDAFYIVDKKGRIKWQWFACDHFDEMGFSDAAKEGIMNVNVGRGSVTDWQHSNNINWLGDNKWYRMGYDEFHPDNIIVDSRSTAMIYIIDHETGEIVWKVGPEYNPDTPWADLGVIVGPHTAHMIPDGLPGAGNILVFDNGGRSNYGSLRGTDCEAGVWPNALRDHSRALEFNPITLQVVWEYTQTDPEGFYDDDGNFNRKFYSSFISSVQRLPNGNTLICEGNQGRIFEVTVDSEIVWEYMTTARPGGPGVIGRALYRAYRYPWSWLEDDDHYRHRYGHDDEDDDD
jgi:hypothetical protein